MNTKMITDNEKPVLTPEGLISAMLDYVLDSEDDNISYLSVIIGPDYDTDSETNSFLRSMYPDQNSFDGSIDSLKSAMIDQDSIDYKNKDDIVEALRKLDKIPEDLKIYYLAYAIHEDIQVFRFDKEKPTYDIIPDDELNNTDPILDKIKQKYQPLTD